MVTNDLPAKTIPELIALAKKDPGKLNYGSTGVGSGSHLATELFMTRTGTKMTHVPFRGAAPLVQELMAGRIDVSNSTLPSVLGQFQAGQMRAIGIASPQRNPQAPDVPTLREQGITDADAESWAAFFAPVNTPKPILDKLSGTIIAILNKPDVKERITKLGFTLNVREPGGLQALPRQGDPDLGGHHQGRRHQRLKRRTTTARHRCASERPGICTLRRRSSLGAWQPAAERVHDSLPDRIFATNSDGRPAELASGFLRVTEQVLTNPPWPRTGNAPDVSLSLGKALEYHVSSSRVQPRCDRAPRNAASRLR